MPRDPFHVLGLPRDATEAEVKRAYRRLAKAFHPDAAGGAATARFLEVQAAYEALVGGLAPGGRPARARRGTPAREPWRADPDRAREAREAGRGRTRRGSADGRTAGDGSSAADGRTAGSGRPQAESPPRGRGPHNRATPGSTTYDGADQEPFDPDWSGASWYGTTSGTYWTVNPREYADPRKHGPEYQARARRRSTRGDGGPPESANGGPQAEPSGGSAGLRSGTAASGDRPAGATGAAWGGPAASDAGAGRPDAASPAGGGAGPRPSAGASARQSVDRRARFSTQPPRARGNPDPPGESPSRSITGFVDDARHTVSGRVGLALVGWVPIGIALVLVVGEGTGCSRFVEGCEGPFGVATVIGQGSVVALLLLLPRLAVIATLGTVAMLAAALPSVAALSIAGGPRDPAGVVPPFVVLLALGWVVGVAVGIRRAALRIESGGRPPVP